MDTRDVLIIGAGPAGLAAAIAATKAGLTYQVIEKGALVNSLLHYPTEMVFFTTPELMEIGGLPFTSPNDKPSRMEALRYYRRATDTYKLDVVVRRDGRRASAARRGRVRRRGGRQVAEAGGRSRGREPIVLATGAYDFPNLMGVPGEDLPHVSHYFTAPHPFYRKRVVIVGGKNSAAEAALDLYRAGAQRDDRPPPRGAGRFDQVLGQARHREPDQGRLDRGAVQHARPRDHADARGRRDGRRPRRDPGRRRVPADRLHLGQPPAPRRRRRDRSGDLRARAQPGHLRDQRPGTLCDRRDGGGEGERPDLHRERPLPRPGGHRRDCVKAV